AGSYEVDRRVVSDEEPMDPRPLEARMDPHVLADERVRDAHRDTLEPRGLEHDRVLDFAAVDEAPRPHRGVRPHEGVADLGAGSDHGGAAHGRPLELRARLDHDLALDAAVRAAPLAPPRGACVEEDPVRLEPGLAVA